MTPAAKRWTLGCALFAGLVAVYLANGDFVTVNDVTPNLYLPVNVVTAGRLSFTPEAFPFMFEWRMDTGRGPARGSVPRWEPDAIVLYNAGKLTVEKGQYYVVPAVRGGGYVNFFGPGAGLTALPVVGPLCLAWQGFAADPVRLWYVGKCLGAVFVAASAVCVFASAAALAPLGGAFLIALAYGLGTCVWSTCSQGWWQQSPNVFFLALGTYFLARLDRGRRYAVWSAMAYAWAVWCRPTSGLVVVCVAVYLLLRDRKAFGLFVLAGLPFAVGLIVYNWYYLGAPLTFGQTEGAKAIALTKTASAAVWQTPLYVGLAGLLVSPSRGLFVFSPFLLFALWGTVRAWRDRSFVVLRPLSVAALLMLLVESKHFDWWGGWSYGYRHIIDITVFLAFLLAPTVPTIRRYKVLQGAAAVLLAWSVLLQSAGVFAYDLFGWNDRQVSVVISDREPVPHTVLETDTRVLAAEGYRVLGTTALDIDRAENRHRLWSVTDSQPLYYLCHFQAAREERRVNFEQWVQQQKH